MHVEILPVTAFQQNCSIIWDEQRNAAIIDPGGEAEKLIEFIETQQLQLEKILLTHGHLDHVGAANRLKQHFQVEIWGPNSADQFLFDSLPAQSQRFGLAEIAVFYPDHWLDKEGEIITVGDMNFEILHLPGHTPGHIGFIEQQKNIAFSGDVLFYNSVGRTDFPRGDHQQLLSSIRQKLFKLNDEMIVIAGHGPATKIGLEKQNNPFIKN
ncbi:MBL fold metallo-hydrolase [Testudinibacter sp. TR-2022]|uniref:MBL fold metallo-hydrolase n=1 Tax=Testudinibacter sp. TR-2022 TaxID=2585029 RepID=UPI0011192677|nr:MBL fold metallo-hydrolase [Testudinibacter sp. TR-2022]TNH06921.1 MBL fold metallo-hydrolase [Pasteurellaceae bacterium Phil11]TNH20408.1 MBL fold metallo-hydrolase [Testudinibacter sp. TR-2022]TNH21611.1 MBL fold metallo-hydrolase [Testudinibacter sp. TR-2022]